LDIILTSKEDCVIMGEEKYEKFCPTLSYREAKSLPFVITKEA